MIPISVMLSGNRKGMTRFRHLPEVIRQIVIPVVGSKFGAAYEVRDVQ